MKRKLKRQFSDPALYLSIGLGLVPLIVSAVYYDQLPMRIAVHWTINGQPDRYASPYFSAVVLPAVLLILNVPVVMAINADLSRRQSFYTTCLKFLLPVVSNFLLVVLVLHAVIEINYALCLPMVAGILVVILAAHLPACQWEQRVGILLPWTLRSKRNWNMTHKVACGVCGVSGFLLIAAAYVWPVPLICTAVALSILTPLVFSAVYAKLHHE